MASETERILREYDRRAREIPQNFYSITRPSNLYGFCQRIRNLVEMLNEEGIFPLKEKRILDVGCGGGHWLLNFVMLGANFCNLAGIELLQNRVDEAKNLLPGADIRNGNAENLSWESESFDIVLQSVVFTSILDSNMKKKVAAEMIRVLKPEGLIIWFDFMYNNPKNPNVKGIKSGEIKSLFPNTSIRFKKVVLAPPIARRLIKYSWILGLMIESLPFLRTHYLAAIKKNVIR